MKIASLSEACVRLRSKLRILLHSVQRMLQQGTRGGRGGKEGSCSKEAKEPQRSKKEGAASHKKVSARSETKAAQQKLADQESISLSGRGGGI